MSRKETITLWISGIVCILIYWFVFAELNANGGIKRVILKPQQSGLPADQPSDLRYISPIGTGPGSYVNPMSYDAAYALSGTYLIAWKTGSYTNRGTTMNVTNQQEPPITISNGYPVNFYVEIKF